MLIWAIALVALTSGEPARRRYSRPSYHQPQTTYRTVRTYSQPSYSRHTDIRPSYSRPSHSQPSYRSFGAGPISRSGGGYKHNRGQTVTYGTSYGNVRKVVIDGGYGNGGFIQSGSNHGAYKQGPTHGYNKGSHTYGHHNPQSYRKSQPKIYGHAQQTYSNTPQRYGDTPQVNAKHPDRFNDDVQLDGFTPQHHFTTPQRVRYGDAPPADIRHNNIPAIEAPVAPGVADVIPVLTFEPNFTPAQLEAAVAEELAFAPPLLPHGLANSGVRVQFKPNLANVDLPTPVLFDTEALPGRLGGGIIQLK